MNDSPVPDLAGVVRIQEQEPPRDLERLVPGLLLEVDRLEIVQHPGEEVPLADRREMLLLKRDRSAKRPGHELLTAFGSEDGPTIERIQQHPASLWRLESHDEVSREADAVDGQLQPPADLDQDQRERDGDAEAAVEDVIEEAVPRIVILLAVSPEALLLEKKLAQAMEPTEGIALRAPGPGIGGEPVQATKVRPDVQVWVLRLGDQQRRSRQIDLRLRPLNRDGELPQ